jgi:hypothetical protein
VNVVEPIERPLPGRRARASPAIRSSRSGSARTARSSTPSGTTDAPTRPTRSLGGDRRLPGEVTIAGSGGAQHNGLLLRLRPTAASVHIVPGLRLRRGSVFLLDSFVELPTTGYVAGGSAVT